MFDLNFERKKRLPTQLDAGRSKPQPATGTTGRPYLRLGIVGVLFAWLAIMGCGGPIPWQVQPPASGNCDLRKELQNQKKYSEASPYDDPSKLALYADTPALRSPYRTLFSNDRELGCLVLLEAGPAFTPLDSQAVAITELGKVQARNQTSGVYDVSPTWKLSAQELKEKPLGLHLYFLRQGSTSEADHAEACKTLIKAEPKCFSNDPQVLKNQLCWFYVKLAPNTPKDSPFQFKSLGSAGSCQICAREICGNGIDDDCDGIKDEGCGDNDCHHPGKSRDCYTEPAATKGQGICKAGKQTCQTSKGADGKERYTWDACVGQVSPLEKEECNGVDDNCNGRTDEDLKDCCLVGDRRSCQNASGCGASQEICTFATGSNKGEWKGCSGDPTPKTDNCDGVDNDCDGQIDEDFPAGGACGTGLPGDCARGKEVCLGKKGISCEPVSKPGVELCDNIDNDCNGQVDEFFDKRGQRCTVQQANGPCAVGIWVDCVNGAPECKSIYEKSQELCGDNVDNDCDGKVDTQDDECDCKPGETGACYPHPDKSTRNKGDCKDGTRTCMANGKWGKCTGASVPQTEVCNGKDDNCDGNIDETFPTKGKLCPTFNAGPCGFGRFQRCGTAAQSYSPQCIPLFQKAPKEICNNGIDDNCDGVIDESSVCSCDPAVQRTQRCNQAPNGLAGIGQCTRGTMTCQPNKIWSGCIGSIDPQEEQCDGKDNDCNGRVDEADTNLNKPCNVAGQQGICKAGKRTCKQGRLVCTSISQAATSDKCNGLDDDCDGTVDEDDPEIGKPCVATGKNGACGTGTLSCKSGTLQCDASTAPKAESCNGIDDDCDGSVDNKIVAPPCDATAKPGVCAQAKKLCGGKLGWLDCQLGDYFRNDSSFEPKETRCDGKDNDCDGKIDADANGAPLKRPCYRGEDGKEGTKGTQDIGNCKTGSETCNAGSWGKCEGVVLPQKPDCDSNGDADCNGRIDKDEPGCGCWGSGRDGTLTVKQRIELDQVKGTDLVRKPANQRGLPDIVSFKVNKIEKNKLTLEKKPSGIDVGDEIVLLHMQGDSKRLGTYEFHNVSKLEGQSLLLSGSISKTYGADGNDDLKDQIILAIRVPHYKQVLIKPGGHLTVSPWNGSSGGVLVFRAQEVIRIEAGGVMSAGSAGYQGGNGVQGNKGEARAGASGTGWPNDKTGQDSGGHGAANGTQASGGGGGGYVTAGQKGRNDKEQDGASGGTKAYDQEDLSKRVFMGGGGGGGAADSSAKGASESNQSGNGGAGGGIIIAIAHTLNITGQIHANGAAGQSGKGIDGRIGGGGGGAGGSIFIQLDQLVRYGTALLEANGGAGGSGVIGAPNGATPINAAKGGKGGNGRIYLLLRSLNGTTNTAATEFKAWSTPVPTTKTLPSNCR